MIPLTTIVKAPTLNHALFDAKGTYLGLFDSVYKAFTHFTDTGLDPDITAVLSGVDIQPVHDCIASGNRVRNIISYDSTLKEVVGRIEEVMIAQRDPSFFMARITLHTIRTSGTCKSSENRYVLCHTSMTVADLIKHMDLNIWYDGNLIARDEHDTRIVTRTDKLSPHEDYEMDIVEPWTPINKDDEIDPEIADFNAGHP